MVYDPVAQKARNKLWTETWAGRFHRQTVCETCGFVATKFRNVVAHHEDYSKPLDVRWFCMPCNYRHHQARAQIRAELHST